jgi:hypothetical protein
LIYLSGSGIAHQSSKKNDPLLAILNDQVTFRLAKLVTKHLSKKLTKIVIIEDLLEIREESTDGVVK